MSREHGTRAMYVVEKCRCDACRQAVREYERERKRRVEPAYVGADRARQHIRWLAEHEIGLKQVSKVSGVSHGALWKLMYGDEKRFGRPSKRIRRATEQAILTVQPQDGADGSRVDAGPTVAIIAELLRRGWSKQALGRHVHGPTAKALQIHGETVTRGAARTVESLLSMPVEYRHDRWGKPIIPVLDDQGEPVEPERVDDPLAGLRLPDGISLDWRDKGTCKRPEFPTWLFFPGRGDNETVRRALEVCERCPVIDDCLRFAVATNASGVWGGTTEKQRRNMKRAAA